ncbi:hypothetical protein GHT06_022511 [Daphnia sinensis]|uniref:Uncharacterized protein n=1 Tax=Daphnia sinensis TaxID=1820382 RepID=A0AAD5KHP6_9CRUS|nr:hypothetical protein GHT06_022511 [Daphnia sinensis]
MENLTVRKFHSKNRNSRYRRVPQFNKQSQPDLCDRNLNFDQTKKFFETSLGHVILDGE